MFDKLQLAIDGLHELTNDDLHELRGLLSKLTVENDRLRRDRREAVNSDSSVEHFWNLFPASRPIKKIRILHREARRKYARISDLHKQIAATPRGESVLHLEEEIADHHKWLRWAVRQVETSTNRWAMKYAWTPLLKALLNDAEQAEEKARYRSDEDERNSCTCMD